MPFLCCQSSQTAVDPALTLPTLENRIGSVVIASIEALPPRQTNNETKSAEDALGIQLAETTEQDRLPNSKIHRAIIVEKICPQSPFQLTPLREGMVLFQINDINIENRSLAQVQEILRRATFPLRLWAQSPSPPPPSANGSPPTTGKNKSSLQAATRSKSNGHYNQAHRSNAGVLPNIAPKTILAVAHKEEVDQTLDFSLKRTDSGTFIVDKIQPTSPFYHRDKSLLREGMKLTSINGLSITGMNMEVAMSAIRDAPGSVVLAAEVPPNMEDPPMIRKRIVAIIYKLSPDQPLGLSLIRIPHRNTSSSPHGRSKEKKFITVVGRIAPSCPFRNTDLDVGMEITSINGLDVSKSDARAVVHLLQESCGKIVILAEMDVPTEETITTASSVSESRSSSPSSSPRLQPNQSHLTVTSPGSVQNSVTDKALARTAVDPTVSGARSMPQQPRFPLPPNAELLSSGNHPTAGSLFVMPEERVYPASNSSATSSYSARSIPGLLTASAIKMSPDHFLGVAINEDSLGSFFVSELSHDSPFQCTRLQVGAEIISINGVQLTGIDVMFVSNLLRSIVGTVTLEFLLPTPSQVGSQS